MIFVHSMRIRSEYKKNVFQMLMPFLFVFTGVRIIVDK
jgi:hypothetical protein